jgi:hypothetical protein
MSCPPQPPGCGLVKYSRCSSGLRAGQLSHEGVLSVVRGCGSPQGSSMLSRFDTYRSRFDVPGLWRFEEKKRLSPFFEIVTQLSRYGEFTTGPRFTGTDHSVKTRPGGLQEANPSYCATAVAGSTNNTKAQACDTILMEHPARHSPRGNGPTQGFFSAIRHRTRVRVGERRGIGLVLEARIPVIFEME